MKRVAFGALVLSLLVAAVTLIPAGMAMAAPNRVAADLISETTSVKPGSTMWVALRLRPPQGWHTYWSNPGDSGLATTIDWALPTGFAAGPIAWPRPERLLLGPLAIYAYEGEAVLLTPIKIPAQLSQNQQVKLNADASWVVCKDICIPEQAKLNLTLPVAEHPAPVDPSVAALFSGARAALPEVSPWPISSWLTDQTISVRLVAPGLDHTQIANALFFPKDDGVVDASASQQLSVDSDGLTVTAPRAGRSNSPSHQINGVLEFDAREGGSVVRHAFTIDAPIAAAPSGTIKGMAAGLVETLLLALLGGLILNLMPCVLPVLAIKALGLTQQAAEDMAVARRHGLAFTAGVLVFFGLLGALIMALRAAGASVGWGFQLQSPIVVAVAAYILFLVGLNLSGVFELGTISIGSRLADSKGYAGSFFTGVLATLVASPCTAPFMGAALGVALISRWYIGLLIFEAVGLGMALPYLLLSFAPRLIRLLPPPGAWLGPFKQALAFPMYGASIWLVWVVARQVGVDALVWALAGLLFVGLSAWLVGLRQTSSGRARLLSGGLATAAIIAALGLVVAMPAPNLNANRPQTAGLAWEAFSPERLAALRAQQTPVMVDITAAWCVSCLVNDATVLRSNEFAQAVTRNHVALLRGDWTTNDPKITRFLDSFDRAGVPLYVLYPGRSEQGAPIVLPQILTKANVIEAIESLTSESDQITKRGAKL